MRKSLEQEIEDFLSQYLPDYLFDIKSSPSRKVVHDGLWGTLQMKPTEICFMDTPLVQRLRQIHQMGFAYFTYPSTKHSRFEHTLGVMLQAEKLGKALIKLDGEQRINEADIDKMRLAALFHDLGHGPFSHSSEEIFGVHPYIEKLKKEHPAAQSHEIISYLIIRSQRFKKFCEKIVGICPPPTDIIPDEIASYIIGEGDPSLRYKRELINGPFDSDKLDYLFRDSHFSGLPLSIDLDRLWYTVRIQRAKGQPRLIVTHSGATPLEQLLFSKMVLFTTVYHHHKVRACDCMFAGIIEYMKQNGISMRIGDRKLSWKSPLDFLWVTDSEFLSFGFETKDDGLHSLIHNLFFRRLLKRAIIISNKTIQRKDDDKYDELMKHKKKSSESSKARREIANRIWELAGKPCLPQEIWLDLPESPQMKAADDTFVLPAEMQGEEPIALNELFPTGKWVQQYGMNKWRGHVFCPANLCEKVGKAAKSVLEDEYGIEILPEAFTWCKNVSPQKPARSSAPSK